MAAGLTLPPAVVVFGWGGIAVGLILLLGLALLRMFMARRAAQAAVAAIAATEARAKNLADGIRAARQRRLAPAVASAAPDPAPLIKPAPLNLEEGRVEGLPGFGDPVTLPAGARVRVAVEVGSTTAKTVVLDEQGNIVQGTYQKHRARVYEMAALLLEATLERFKDQVVVNVGFSGSAGRKVADRLAGFIDHHLEATHGVAGKKGRVNIRYTNEVISQTAPILALYGHLGKDIHIIEIGGEDSKFIHLGPDGTIKRTALNGECAAGTGTFLEEQVPRLGYADLCTMIEGAWSVSEQEPPTIAGRCTVFAKSDITHLLRHENLSKEFVAWGVNHAVALTFLVNLVGSVRQGLAGDGIVVFQGGTSKNRVLVEAFRKILEKNGIDPARLIVPEYPEVRVAQGAATFAAEGLAAGQAIEREALLAGLAQLKDFVVNRRVYSALPTLTLRDPDRMRKTWQPHQFAAGEKRDVFLGLDVGSTTTKLVLIDAQTEALLYKAYLRTEGRPFEVMEEGLRAIRDQVGKHINILHVGVTGSGREAVGAMVGADVVVDEINAHARAVGQLYPQADTILEIGGQDSKFMRVMRGVVVDFEMNKACAAGTGSFFDEAANRILGVLVTELGAMGLQAMAPADLGEVCTVFMKSRIVQAQAEGYTPDDIAAGLAYSIAKNFLNKVKGAKPLGNSIVFQGGVSNNPAVVAAFEQITGKEVIVPEHAEVMGAIGMALIAKTRYATKAAAAEKAGEDIAKRVASAFRGLDAGFVPTEVTQAFRCTACANKCQLMQLKTPEGQRLVYGGGCDLHNKSIPKDQKRLSENLPDLLAVREELLRRPYSAAPDAAAQEAPEGRGGRLKAWLKGLASLFGRPAAKSPGGVVAANGRVVGFPAGLSFWENFPFWNAFFTAAGFEVAVSEASGKKILDLAKKHLNTDTCLPYKMFLGMVADLLEQEGVTDIFLPALLNLKPLDPRSAQAYPCPTVMGTPHTVTGVLDAAEHSKRFLSPELDLSRPGEEILEQFRRFGAELGLPPEVVERAYAAAEAAAEKFRAAQRSEGAKILAELKATGRKAIVLVGRPYTSLDPAIMMAIDREARKRGWQVLPMDFLPLEEGTQGRTAVSLANDTSYYQGKMLAAAEAIADNPQLFPVYISVFKCGPDGFILKQVEERMRAAGKPLLTLEFDELNSAAGYKTRMDAYIASVELAEEAARIVADKAASAAALGADGRPLPPGLSFMTLEELRRKKVVFIPHMLDSSHLVAGALRAEGVNAVVFHPPTDEALAEGRKHSNGKECLPSPITTGEALVGIRDAVAAGIKPEEIGLMWFKSGGACRFSQYSRALAQALTQSGFEAVQVVNIAGKAPTPKVPNHFTPSLGLACNLWRGYLVGDYMHQILLENRPYEIHTEETARRKAELIAMGSPVLGDFVDLLDSSDPDYLRKAKLCDLIYQRRLLEASQAMGDVGKLRRILDRFVSEIRQVPQDRTKPRPLIGVAGEIYVRLNDYASGDLIRKLETLGAEVFLAPMSEFLYAGVGTYMNGEPLSWKTFLNFKGLRELLGCLILQGYMRYHDGKIFKVFKDGLRRPQFGLGRDVPGVVAAGREQVGCFGAGEGPLTIGAIAQFAHHHFDGAVSIGPLGCMPQLVANARIPKMLAGLDPGLRLPVACLDMSEAMNLKNIMTRIENLAEQASRFMRARREEIRHG